MRKYNEQLKKKQSERVSKQARRFPDVIQPQFYSAMCVCMCVYVNDMGHPMPKQLGTLFFFTRKSLTNDMSNRMLKAWMGRVTDFSPHNRMRSLNFPNTIIKTTPKKCVIINIYIKTRKAFHEPQTKYSSWRLWWDPCPLKRRHTKMFRKNFIYFWWAFQCICLCVRTCAENIFHGCSFFFLCFPIYYIIFQHIFTCFRMRD